MPVDHSLAEQMIAAAQKRVKGVTIRDANAIDQIERIPFRSIEMTMASWGGVPLGKFTRLWGGPGSMKSTTAWGVIKNATETKSERFPDGMNAVYYNVENAYDPEIMTRLGIDPDRVQVIDVDIIEDIVDLFDELQGGYNIHVIDSATEAMASAFWKASTDSRQPGLHTQAWGNAWKRLNKMIDKTDNAIIVIDQARIDFHTGAQKVAGGMGSAHKADLQIHFRKGSKLFRTERGDWTETRPQKANDILSGLHREDGRLIQVEIDKSRVCRIGGRALMRYDHEIGRFDEEFELVKAGIALGVIKRSGAHYYAPTNGEKSLHGEAALIAHMRENPFLENAIWEAAFEWCKGMRNRNHAVEDSR